MGEGFEEPTNGRCLVFPWERALAGQVAFGAVRLCHDRAAQRHVDSWRASED